MRVQLAAPILGTSDYRARFAEAAARWREHGYEVIDPTRFWPKACSPPCADGCVWCPTQEEAMIRCLRSLIMRAGAVIRLAGWEQSVGARLEVEVATRCGLVVLDDA